MKKAVIEEVLDLDNEVEVIHKPRTLGQVKKHLRSGRPNKYDPTVHIPLLVDIFGNCEGIAAFCAEAMIHKATFDLWIAANPDFKEAFGIALQIGQRKWERRGGEPDINQTYWWTIMHNRYHYGKTKIQKLKNRTSKELVEHIWDNLEKGELTDKQLILLGNLALQIFQVEQSNSGDVNQPIADVELPEMLKNLATIIEEKKESKKIKESKEI